jgi:hypothetical protein
MNPFLISIVVYLFFIEACWFVVQIAISSTPSQSANIGSGNSSNILGFVAIQTSTIYFFQLLILVGSVAAVSFGDHFRTRASKFTGFIAATFAVFAWFVDLFWIVFALDRGHNEYCQDSVDLDYCQLTHAVAILSVIKQSGQVLLMIYAFFLYYLPSRSQSSGAPRILVAAIDNTAILQQSENRTWFTEYEELEDSLAKQAETKLKQNDATTFHTIHALNNSNFWLTLLSLAGYIIATLSLIRFSATFNRPDAVVIGTIRQISYLLVFSLSVSAYAVYRRKRAIIAAAAFLAFVTALQIWSIYIYIGRRPRQLEAVADIDATRAFAVGLGLVVAAETLRSIVLTVRYRTFAPIILDSPITPAVRISEKIVNSSVIAETEHTDPLHSTTITYYDTVDRAQVQQHKEGSTRVAQLLFYGAVASFFTWFLLQFILTCLVGLFDNEPIRNVQGQTGPLTSFGSSIPHYLVVLFTAPYFTIQCLLFARLFVSFFYAERVRTKAAWGSAAGVAIIVFSAWWLLIWPLAYHTSFRNGFVSYIYCIDVATFANAYCRLTQGIGIAAIIQIFFISFVLVYSIFRAVVANRVQLTGVENYKLANTLNFSTVLILCGILTWSLANIDQAIRASTYVSSFFALNALTLPVNASADIQNTYWYITAFPLFIILSFLLWNNLCTANSSYYYNSNHYRFLNVILAITAVFLLFPTFILTCRFINNLNFLDGELAISAGIIILMTGLFLNALTGIIIYTRASVKTFVQDEIVETNQTSALQSTALYTSPAALQDVELTQLARTSVGNQPNGAATITNPRAKLGYDYDMETSASKVNLHL